MYRQCFSVVLCLSIFDTQIAMTLERQSLLLEAETLRDCYGLSIKDAVRQLYSNELSKVDGDAAALAALRRLRQQVEGMSE